jgi:hypothetical protein
MFHIAGIGSCTTSLDLAGTVVSCMRRSACVSAQLLGKTFDQGAADARLPAFSLGQNCARKRFPLFRANVGVMRLNLPQKVDDRLRIEGCNDRQKRELEARGFHCEVVTPQYLIFRRDYPDGALKTTR